MVSTTYPTESQAVGGRRSEASDSLGHLDAFSHEKDRRCHWQCLSFYRAVVRICNYLPSRPIAGQRLFITISRTRRSP